VTSWLVDTNVLLRLAHRSQPMYSTIRPVFRRLSGQGERFFCAAQNFIEFWNVTTRPLAVNGFGLSLARTDRLLRRMELVFRLLPSSRQVYTEWRHLVTVLAVSGVQVHDAHLVATMRVHGIRNLLTFNVADFVRYAPLGILAVDPRTIP